ncbi:MAG: hypothetical protein II237_06760 [Clostridia bacterium]|nr:hypothetical protein [Clostridia bacterium]
MDADLVAKWKANQANLKGPIEIGDDGQLKEWYEETTIDSLKSQGADPAGHRLEKSKSSRFLLDGTGLYIKKGAFPAEWATGSKPVMFENSEFPGVNDAEGYLSRWYGEGYMIPPEISKRTSGHKISRLDLGKHIYDNHSESSISLSGELYD